MRDLEAAVEEASEEDAASASSPLGSGQFYGEETFDPRFILTQMAVLQSSYYVVLSGLVLLSFGMFGLPKSVVSLFNAEAYGFDSPEGRLLDAVVLLTGAAMSLVVAKVVERSKKCLDFVVTYHVMHAVTCWVTAGFPFSYGFWISSVASACITVLAAERLCMQQEMEEIRIKKTPAQRRVNQIKSLTSSAVELVSRGDGDDRGVGGGWSILSQSTVPLPIGLSAAAVGVKAQRAVV